MRRDTMSSKEQARSFLESAMEARLEARRRKARADELSLRCNRLVAAAGGAPGRGGGDMQLLWAALADERDREQAAELEELKQYRRVEDFIGRLPEPSHRMILKRRYLAGQTNWVQVQQRLSRDGMIYSESHLKRLHGQALESAGELWETEHEAPDEISEKADTF